MSCEKVKVCELREEQPATVLCFWMSWSITVVSALKVAHELPSNKKTHNRNHSKRYEGWCNMPSSEFDKWFKQMCNIFILIIVRSLILILELFVTESNSKTSYSMLYGDIMMPIRPHFFIEKYHPFLSWHDFMDNLFPWPSKSYIH